MFTMKQIINLFCALFSSSSANPFAKLHQHHILVITLFIISGMRTAALVASTWLGLATALSLSQEKRGEFTIYKRADDTDFFPFPAVFRDGCALLNKTKVTN